MIIDVTKAIVLLIFCPCATFIFMLQLSLERKISRMLIFLFGGFSQLFYSVPPRRLKPPDAAALPWSLSVRCQPFQKEGDSKADVPKACGVSISDANSASKGLWLPLRWLMETLKRRKCSRLARRSVRRNALRSARWISRNNVLILRPAHQSHQTWNLYSSWKI